MKKYIFTLIAIAFIHCTSTGQTATAPTGTGVSGDPYLIATLNNLYWVTQNSSSWTSYFKQTANIDATSTSTWDSGNGFSPIGNSSTNFRGNYNGQGYTINNLFINRTATDNIGLFGYANSATISNIALTNVNITGRNYVGALIGQAYTTTISYCYSTGTMNGGIDGSNNGSIGGLIGNGNGSVQYCYSSCNVTGKKRVGGFIGNFSNLSVNCCYATGSVILNGTLNNTYAGGFGGDCEASIVGYVMSNCYATGQCNKQLFWGIGVWRWICWFFRWQCGSYNPKLLLYRSCKCCKHTTRVCCTNTRIPVNTNCFFDTQTTGQAVAGNTGITGKTTAEMTTTSTFTNAGWDFVGETTNGTNNYWDRTDGINSGYPVLTFVMPVPPIAWTGATSTNWNTVSNWSTTVVPTSTDDITIQPQQTTL